jgi:hypothetical protein
VRVLAGNYHRDSQGIKDSFLFFRDMGEMSGDGDAMAKDIARRRGIDYVLICADGGNVGFSFTTTDKGFAALKGPKDGYKPDETLYTRLADEDPPDWLKPKPWPNGVNSDLLLYQVDRSRLGGK